MQKDTMEFIHALKRTKNGKTIRQTAIEFLCKWSMSPPISYEAETNLFGAVLQFFYDYVETADNPVLIWREYFDYKARRYFYQEDFTDTDILLTILEMTQVLRDGEYINGFTSYMKELMEKENA